MARRILLVLLSLVVLVVLAAGGLLALLTFRPETFKGQAERYLSAQLGRPVTIDGPVALDLGRVVTLDASGIKVANPAWAQARDLADIGHLRVGVDLGAYWRDRSIVLTELRLDRPQLALERDAQGQTSWPSSSGGNAGSSTNNGNTNGSASKPGSSLPRIDALTITDGRVAYRDAQDAVDITSSVATDPPKPGAVHDFGGLKLDGQGQVRGGPASFALEVGSPLLLAQGTANPFPVKGRLTLAGTDLKLDGQDGDPLALQGVDLALDLASQDPTKLLAFAGVPATQAPPDLGVKARLTRQDAVFRLADLDAGWAQSRLTGQLAYDPSAQRPTVTGDLHSPFLDVAALEPVFAGGPSSGKQDSSSGSGPAALAAYDADLKLAADRVRLPQAELRDVAARVKLAAGHLTLDPLRVGLPQGNLQGRVEAADLTKSPLETAVDVTAQGIDLAGVPGLAGQNLTGRFEGTLTGTLRGTDLATLLAQSEAALKGRLDGARYAKASLRQGDLEARLGQGELTVDPPRAR